MGSKTRSLRGKARPVYLQPEHIRAFVRRCEGEPGTSAWVVHAPARHGMTETVWRAIGRAWLLRSRPPGHARARDVLRDTGVLR
jgi:hypothetical protein